MYSPPQICSCRQEQSNQFRFKSSLVVHYLIPATTHWQASWRHLKMSHNESCSDLWILKSPIVAQLNHTEQILCSPCLLHCRIYESHRNDDSLYISVRLPPPLGVHAHKPFICVVWFSQRTVCLVPCTCECVCVHICVYVFNRMNRKHYFLRAETTLLVHSVPEDGSETHKGSVVESDELWIISVNNKTRERGRVGGRVRGRLMITPLTFWCTGPIFIYSFIHLCICLTL